MSSILNSLNALRTRVVNLVTAFKVTLPSDDSEAFPSVQVSYMGTPVNITRLLPYPLVGQPTVDMLGVKLNIQAQEQNRVGIVHDPENRLKNLKAGEGGIHNSQTGSFVLLLENGDVKVVALNDLIQEITKDVLNTIGGDLTNTVTGDITNTAKNINDTSITLHTITAPEILEDGNVTITGTLSTTGSGASTLGGAFGCNGQTAQTQAALGAAATDLSSVITLANNIRTALINNGIGS